MAERIEKQLTTIEALIKDKESMQNKIEEMIKKGREREGGWEK